MHFIATDLRLIAGAFASIENPTAALTTLMSRGLITRISRTPDFD
jgi:hypothetical protein